MRILKRKKIGKIIAAERGYVAQAGTLQKALFCVSGHPDYVFSRITGFDTGLRSRA